MTGAETTVAEGQNGATTDVTGVDAPGNPAEGLSAPPTKKESSLREFLGKMDDYAPIVSFRRSSPSFPPFLQGYHLKSWNENKYIYIFGMQLIFF
jgi:hypothetical protein